MAFRKRGLSDDEIRKLLLELSDQSDAESEIETNGNVKPDETDDSDHVSIRTVSDEELDTAEQRGEVNPPPCSYISRNGTEWAKIPPPISRQREHNIMKLAPGPTRFAIQRVTENPISAMKLFITDEMMKMILEESNREYKRVYEEKRKEYLLISAEELEAYIGLTILAGVYKSSGESLKELWSEEDGRNIFRATMSLQRFETIRQFLRFDNKENRVSRRRTDKLAAIRTLFEMFISQMPKMFIPYENVTIDEQLVPFRGKCPFRQYLPSKPRGKYGIKLWLMSDVKTAYVCAAEVYIGKPSSGERELNQGRNVVLRLVQTIEGTSRNVTTDNFFTDYILAKELLKKQLTLVGTLRKNKSFIPSEFQPRKDRVKFSSLFGFQHDVTLVSYVPKINKSVNLLSTLHHDATVSTNEQRKPEIILHYNETKGGVDTTDKLAATYSCKRGTRRWPISLFYNLIDLAAINAFVIFVHVNPSYNENKLYKRRLFLKELGKQFTERQRSMRMVKCVKMSVNEKLCQAKGGTSEKSNMPKRGRCKECGPKKDRKSQTRCISCSGFLCQEHVNVYCKSCLK